MHFMVQGGAHADRGINLRDGRPKLHRRRDTGLGCCCDRRGGMGFLAGTNKLAAAASLAPPPKKVVKDPAPKNHAAPKITAAAARAATKAAIKRPIVTARAPALPAASPLPPALLAVDQSSYADASAVDDLYGDAPPLAIGAQMPAISSGDDLLVTQARSVTPAAMITPANARAATRKQLARNAAALLTKGQRLRAAGQNVPTKGQLLRAMGVNVPTAGQKLRAALRPTPPRPSVLEQQQQPAGMVPADQTGASYEDQGFIDRGSVMPVGADVVDQLTPGPEDSESTADYGGDDGFDDYGGNGEPLTDEDDGGAGDIDEYGDDGNLYAGADADADLYGGEADDSAEDPTDMGGGAHLSGYADDAQCRLDAEGIRRCPRQDAVVLAAGGTEAPLAIAPGVEGDVSGSGGAMSLWGGNGDDVLYDSFDTLNGLGLLGASNVGEKISGISAKAGQVGDIVSRVEALFKGKQKVEAAASAAAQHAPAIATTALVVGGVGLGLFLLSRSKSRKGRRRR